MTDLETRLRRELDAAARDVAPSPDAWQRNQRLVEQRRLGRRRTAWALSAAAAVLLVVVTGAGVLGGNGTAPPAGLEPTSDRLAEKTLPGLVEVARIGTGPRRVAVEMVLVEGKTARPDLCVRFTSPADMSIACGGPSEDAADPGVAFDYLSGYEGDSVAGRIRSVDGVVDESVDTVRAWLTDGASMDATLVPIGTDGLRAFSLPTRVGSPQPVRVAAYGPDGTAIEYVNLATRLGPERFADEPVLGCRADDGCRLDELAPGLIAGLHWYPDRVEVTVWADAKAVELHESDREDSLRMSQSREGPPGSAVIVTTFFFGDLPEPLTGELTVTVTDGTNTDSSSLRRETG
jgi:hypothetical protein